MQENDEWITGAVLLAISIATLAPFVLVEPLKPVTMELLLLLAILLPLEVLSYYLFLSAIRMSALSLTVPHLAFTPVFTVLAAWLLLGETVSVMGGSGISLVTVGAYILHQDPARRGLWAPVRALFSDSGSRRMLLVAFIWSVTSTLGKKGILAYGALPFALLLLVGDLAIFMLIIAARVMLYRCSISLKRWMPALFLFGGLLMAASQGTHFVALDMAPVAYMISVKRLSLVFGVIFGWLIFGEHNIRRRLLGGCVMVAGVFLIYY